MDEQSYRYVEGLRMHKLFKDEAILSAMNYKPREGDVLVVTYPKCGTNWTQFIVYNILSHAAPVSNIGEFRMTCPFIDMTGASSAENPGLTPKTVPDVSFEKFLSLYLEGKVLYGDYFDHLLPWYEHRGAENILFITYEQLKADTRSQVLKIADFLGEQHGTALRKDDDLLQRVLHACSLESMKAIFSVKPVDVAKMRLEASPEESETFAVMKDMAELKVEMHEGSGFVRKGIVGDWRNYFTTEQVKRTKEWIRQKTQGSGVMALWEDCDLP
ncbi:amine sulfotransferase-like isoform X2 [Dermacentor albipictus]|uniref:amine sulfotransferase-like isoform X2 n=1 Tax=Dermacentor albipictus TaxID=60249 RepID=UPI0031FDCE6E